MRKWTTLLFACLLMLMIAPARSEVVSAAELREQIQTAVDGKYEAYDGTVSLHVPVYVPNVDEVPILRVERTNVSAESAEKLGGLLEKNTLYGQRAAKRSTDLTSSASHFLSYEQNLWANDERAATVYAPNQTISLLDAEEFLKEMTSGLFGDQQIACLPYRAGLRSGRPANGEGKGGYYIEAWETLRGIPIVEGVERTFSKQGKRGIQQALSNASWIVLGDYLSETDYICVSTAMWRETECVQPDVQLCDWKRIEQTLEENVQKGRIREVYSVMLGYAVYAASDREYPEGEAVYEAEFLLVPTWFVECKYAENAGKELNSDIEEDDLDAPSYHKERGWKILLIDAQTGKMIDPEDESAKRYIYSL